MKNFDLEAAKRGAAVCMRDGRAVNVLSFNSRVISCGNPEPVVVEYISDGKFEIGTFSDKGEWIVGGECGDDLMMRDDYLEKLERGEYGNHIVDANEMVVPAIKQNLTTDREYWRRMYAGQAMQGIVSALDMNTPIAGDGVADKACTFADALIEELEKTETK